MKNYLMLLCFAYLNLWCNEISSRPRDFELREQELLRYQVVETIPDVTEQVKNSLRVVIVGCYLKGLGCTVDAVKASVYAHKIKKSYEQDEKNTSVTNYNFALKLIQEMDQTTTFLSEVLQDIAILR
jgi:4-hydroxy-3-methylbut-2-en-1-yl diphosphate synthase IspG/GcpE